MKKLLFKQIEQKIYNIIHEQLVKIIQPTMVIREVKDINLQLVKKLKSEYGIGGIILDVDDTLRKQMMKIPDCNKQWIEFMKKEFKVIVLSNGYDGKVSEFCDEKDVPYISFAKKPLKKQFLYACEKMGLYPENILVIGNDIVCDIYGGNRCGMLTAIIDDVNCQNEFLR